MFAEAAAAAAPEVCLGPQAIACAGAGTAACAASAWCRDAAAEFADKASNIISSIFGGDESNEDDVGPYENPEEAKEECPLEDPYARTNKEIGVGSQELIKILQWGEQYLIGQGSNPYNPDPETRHKLVLIIALIARLLQHH